MRKDKRLAILNDVIAVASKEHPNLRIIGGSTNQRGPKKGDNLIDPVYGMVSCKAGTFGMSIDHDGLVFSCEAARNWRVNPVGSILQGSIEDIWKSSKWAFFRDNIYYVVELKV